ncbi:Glutamate racemase [Alkalibacterium sp. AK22]|uniref:glutamate racemase n=1 Tax=Alkalibacterium sp. AK22 TaxID=1229520 RepID=UPI000448F931|nr:Glutamate racemase [Alkalibacterium sp. AK22]
MSNKPIGLLDSGIGGLTVLKAAQAMLPDESFVYIGDSARNPYGDRTSAEIIQYTNELASFLVSQDIKMLIIACNTATALTLKQLQKDLDIPVLGVISAGSTEAIRQTQNGHIGVLATQSTVDSNYYAQTISQASPNMKISSLACPDFVQLVESNQYESVYAATVVEKTLQKLPDQSIDTLILGCTHFPLLAGFIQKAVGPSVHLIDSGALTAVNIGSRLDALGLRTGSCNRQTITLYTTGNVSLFNKIATKWMQSTDMKIKSIPIERLSSYVK